MSSWPSSVLTSNGRAVEASREVGDPQAQSRKAWCVLTLVVSARTFPNTVPTLSPHGLR